MCSKRLVFLLCLVNRDMFVPRRYYKEVQKATFASNVLLHVLWDY